MFDQIQKLGQIKEVIQNAREELKEQTIASESYEGMVKVEVTGNRKISNISVDPELYEQYSPQEIHHIIHETLNNALDKAETQGQEYLQSRVKEYMPDIPGLDPKDFGIGS